MQAQLWGADAALAHASDVFAVYDAVFGDRPDEQQWRVSPSRALLSTDNDDSAAVRLYTKRGWRRLGQLNADTQVMGLLLGASLTGHREGGAA